MSSHPTPSEYFYLSQAANYSNRGCSLPGWRVYAATPNDAYSAGYLGAAFYNETNRHAVIASTVVNDSLLSSTTQQKQLEVIFEHACKFSEETLTELTHMAEVITFTGYYLGALPAGYCAWTHNAQAVVFEIPEAVALPKEWLSDKVTNYTIQLQAKSPLTA